MLRGGGRKQLPHLPGRAGTATLALTVGKQRFDGEAQRRGQALELVETQGNRAAFPMRVGALRDAELVGQLLLAQARGFA